MPRYRSPRSRTEELKMKLSVDLRCIPEWKTELKSLHESIRDRFRLYSLAEVISAATLIRESLSTLGGYVVGQEHEFERWKNTLTVEKLIGIYFDVSGPPSLYRTEEIVTIIRSTLKQTDDYLTKCKTKGVTDSFLVSVFTGKIDVETVRRFEGQKSIYLALSHKIPRIEAALKLLGEINFQSLGYLTRVSEIEKQLALAEEKRGAIERFEAKHGKALAKGAAADNKTRKRVTSLKVVVKKTKDCPYCGGDLGIEPHLDHIYPVTKGGLSIIENLVWCCSTCNGLKSDKGLMQFLMAQGLPIEQTLTRLHAMGKHV